MENSPRQIFRGKAKLWDNTYGIIMFLQTLTKEKIYGSVCVCLLRGIGDWRETKFRMVNV